MGFHTWRRTSIGARVADALSKGNMEEVRTEMLEVRDVSHRASKVLLQCIRDPRVDTDRDRAFGRKGSRRQPGDLMWQWGETM